VQFFNVTDRPVTLKSRTVLGNLERLHAYSACHPEKETAQLTARGVHVRVMSEPEQAVEGRKGSSDAAGGGAADHSTQSSDQQQHMTVAPETEVTTDNSDGNAAPHMQQCGWDVDSLIAGQRNDPNIKVIVWLLEQRTDKPA